MQTPDIIEDAFYKLHQKQTRFSKFYILKRYLRIKYRLEISRVCLFNRIKGYLKTK